MFVYRRSPPEMMRASNDDGYVNLQRLTRQKLTSQPMPNSCCHQTSLCYSYFFFHPATWLTPCHSQWPRRSGRRCKRFGDWPAFRISFIHPEVLGKHCVSNSKVLSIWNALGKVPRYVEREHLYGIGFDWKFTETHSQKLMCHVFFLLNVQCLEYWIDTILSETQILE